MFREKLKQGGERFKYKCIYLIQNDTGENMTATVTTRIPEHVLKQIDQFSTEKHMDRATMLRNFIERGLAEEKQRKTLENYKKRKISLQGAAELLGIHIVEIVELIQREGLYLDYTEEELREDMKGMPS
jgi:predicted HTH domain antitoxin